MGQRVPPGWGPRRRIRAEEGEEHVLNGITLKGLSASQPVSNPAQEGVLQTAGIFSRKKLGEGITNTGEEGRVG